MGITYNTGTITLANGSASVTGSGTAWVANATAGMLLLREGAVLGVVQSVNSNTSLTLVRAHEGPGITAGAYDLISTGAVRQFLADRVQDLIDDVQGFVDGPLAGLFGAGTQSEPGIAFDIDPDTGVRRTVADRLALVAGGIDHLILFENRAAGAAVQSSQSDFATGKLARADWALTRASLLGAVSQSGGVPTGAVIERGSNANGSFTRFADGTQICTHAMNGDTGGAASWTYPAAFVNTTGVAVSLMPVSTAVRYGQLESYSATGVTFSVLTSVGGRAATLTLLTAIGRWF